MKTIFKAEFKDGMSWINGIRMCSWMNDEIKLEFSEKGIYLRLMDRSLIAMLELDYPKKAFKYLAYANKESLILSVDAKNLGKLNNLIDKDNNIIIELLWNNLQENEKSEKAKEKFVLEVSIKDPDYNIIGSYTTPALFNSGYGFIKKPSIKFESSFSLNVEWFKKNVFKLKKLCRSFRLVHDNGEISSVSDHPLSNDYYTASIRVPEYTLHLFKNTQSSIYNCEYLYNILSKIDLHIRKKSLCKIEFKADAPMKITFLDLSKDDSDRSKAVFWLAPRIETK